MNIISIVRRPYHQLKNLPRKFVRELVRPFLSNYTTYYKRTKVNLGSGHTFNENYWGIDLNVDAEMILNLSNRRLPFRNGSMDAVVCISAINYFTYARAEYLIRETFRILKTGGIARFGVQDMQSLAKKYLDNDLAFFFQKLPNGKDRFPGPTIGDKFVAWFYGHQTAGGPNRYFYDFESLAFLFRAAGFKIVERRNYRDSRLAEVALIDNRAEQMFFLEAVKQ